MQEGIIAKLLSEKGFGFIKCEGKDKDLFFHSKELINITFPELHEGDKVSFEVVTDSQERPNATKVSKIA